MPAFLKKENIPEVKSEDKPKKPVTKTKVKKALIALLIKIIVILLVIIALLTVVGGVFVCHDNDNFPAVRDGDLLITYRLGGYYSGDIVVYEVDGKNYIGRVIGVPGDQININENQYTVNGVIPYETVYYKTQARESDVKYPYTVKEGEIFVLADYREEAIDSRVFGGVNKIKGKVVLQLRRRGF